LRIHTNAQVDWLWLTLRIGLARWQTVCWCLPGWLASRSRQWVEAAKGTGW